MAEPVQQTNSGEMMERAVRLMREALDLLDQATAPSDIGAHLDLAINRLDESIKSDRTGG